MGGGTIPGISLEEPIVEFPRPWHKRPFGVQRVQPSISQACAKSGAPPTGGILVVILVIPVIPARSL